MIPSDRSLRPSTLCIHAGTYRDERTGGACSPIFSSTACAFPNSANENFYPRYFNTPNQRVIEQKMAALGTPVTRGPRKGIGWFPITLTPAAAQLPSWRAGPSGFTAWRWHGDVFALPSGAMPLASSEVTAHQAIAFGRAALGILFHLEVTEAMIAGMVANFADKLREAGAQGSQLVAQGCRFLPELGAIAQTIFGGWAGSVKLLPES